MSNLFFFAFSLISVFTFFIFCAFVGLVKLYVLLWCVLGGRSSRRVEATGCVVQGCCLARESGDCGGAVDEDAAGWRSEDQRDLLCQTTRRCSFASLVRVAFALRTELAVRQASRARRFGNTAALVLFQTRTLS